jgi:metallo-beta-lactamase family protein
VNWLSRFRKPPGRTFVVHGESETALGFADLIREGLGWNVDVPEMGAGYALD